MSPGVDIVHGSTNNGAGHLVSYGSHLPPIVERILAGTLGPARAAPCYDNPMAVLGSVVKGRVYELHLRLGPGHTLSVCGPCKYMIWHARLLIIHIHEQRFLWAVHNHWYLGGRANASDRTEAERLTF